MALPWLIGAAVVGLGTLIAAASSDDDKPSSNSGGGNGADEERRRREAAAKEQRRREREEKLANARTLFAEKGASFGEELRDALDGRIEVHAVSFPPFQASLGEAGLGLAASDEGRAHEVSHALREAFIAEDPEVERIVANLEYHARVYDVAMSTHASARQRLTALDAVNTEILRLDALALQLRALRLKAAA